MRLILTGCEYSGKTTLAEEIPKWINRTMGGGRSFHDHWGDHFTIREPGLSEETEEKILKLAPGLRNTIGDFLVEYHMHPSFYRGPDHMVVGFHIEQAIYAPLYYGLAGEERLRSWVARLTEREIMLKVPDTVLILLKASPEVIARRMKENPHPNGLVQEKDIEYVLQKFEEEYQYTLIQYKFELDTSSATVEETMKKFEEEIEPNLSDSDRLRVAAHHALLRGAQA